MEAELLNPLVWEYAQAVMLWSFAILCAAGAVGFVIAGILTGIDEWRKLDNRWRRYYDGS